MLRNECFGILNVDLGLLAPTAIPWLCLCYVQSYEKLVILRNVCWVAGRNFTKLDVNVVKLSVEDKFVLGVRISATSVHVDRRQTD